jgi:hypothetical protein
MACNLREVYGLGGVSHANKDAALANNSGFPCVLARNIRAFLDHVEAGMSVSKLQVKPGCGPSHGGLVCIKVGPLDEATAARLAEQKVCVSFRTSSSFHHTLWLTLLHQFVQRLSQQFATANYKGDKLAGHAQSHEDLGECPRCGHAVSQSAFKSNKCTKKSKFVECCNSRIHKVQTQTRIVAPRRDDAPVYRADCCGPGAWP